MKTKSFAVVALGLFGCSAMTPAPTDKLAHAQETLRMAEQTPNAGVDPEAAQHLQLAKQQLEHGKELMLKGDNEAARWALMRAQADGEVAVYEAQAQAARVDAQATLDAIKGAVQQMQKEGHGS